MVHCQNFPKFLGGSQRKAAPEKAEKTIGFHFERFSELQSHGLICSKECFTNALGQISFFNVFVDSLFQETLSVIVSETLFKTICSAGQHVQIVFSRCPSKRAWQRLSADCWAGCSSKLPRLHTHSLGRECVGLPTLVHTPNHPNTTRFPSYPMPLNH